MDFSSVSKPSKIKWLGRIVRLGVSVVVMLLASAGNVNALVTFNWPSSPGWTAGAPSAGQTNTQSFTSVTANDITVSINNSGSGVQGMVWNTGSGGYPQISANPDTGGFTGVNGLEQLVMSSQAAGTYIKTTVSFATPVVNLSFQIWDVDAVPGQFVDKISNIQAVAQGGGIVGPDSVTSAVPGFNTITGSGLSTVVLGIANAANNTNQGSINITFNGQVTQFSFEWSNNDPGLGAQGITLGPLTYEPVPEIDPAWTAAAACALAVGFELLLTRKSKRSSR
jgi:hypothetical protein